MKNKCQKSSHAIKPPKVHLIMSRPCPPLTQCNTSERPIPSRTELASQIAVLSDASDTRRRTFATPKTVLNLHTAKLQSHWIAPEEAHLWPKPAECNKQLFLYKYWKLLNTYDLSQPD
jgi:hypothetical protein